MHKSLLVVDWDYFFPNPLEGGLKGDHVSLYDWGHAESNLFITSIWPIRASTFLINDLKLPMVEPSWKTFSTRFNLADDAIIYVGDSNMHAGTLEDSEGDPYSDVWLYDAHHDAGYHVASFPEWLSQHVKNGGISFSCEDWMLVHYMQGATLHWRFPTWHEHLKRQLKTGKQDWPGGVDIDAGVDDLRPHPETFDAVYICRSGAWVPPWCDEQFERFVDTWNGDLEQMDTINLHREFDLEQARAEAEQFKNALTSAHGG